MTTQDIAELKRLAIAAETLGKNEPYVTSKGGIVILCGPFPIAKANAKAAYIGAATPETILALIAELESRDRKIAELEAAAVINTRTAVEVLEAAAKLCEDNEIVSSSRGERTLEPHIKETGSTHAGTWYAKFIRALSPLSTDSKSMMKRLDIQREDK